MKEFEFSPTAKEQLDTIKEMRSNSWEYAESIYKVCLPEGLLNQEGALKKDLALYLEVSASAISKLCKSVEIRQTVIKKKPEYSVVGPSYFYELTVIPADKIISVIDLLNIHVYDTAISVREKLKAFNSLKFEFLKDKDINIPSTNKNRNLRVIKTSQDIIHSMAASIIDGSATCKGHSYIVHIGPYGNIDSVESSEGWMYADEKL